MTRTVMNRIPLFYPSSPEHLHISHGQITAIDLDQLNRNVGLIIFNLWPGSLALSDLKGVVRTTANVLFFVMLAVVVMISENLAAQLALLSSSVVVIAMRLWPQCVLRALAVAWCVSFVLVLPASFVAYQNELHFTTWLPETARQRAVIWEHTAEQVLRHPLLGVGIESTPTLRDRQTAIAAPEQPEGFVFPRTLGSHAHNIFLQAWFELGAVGAFLLAIAGAAVVVLIPSLPASARPFAGGSFAAFAVVAAFSWGMWQMWFMSAIALLPLCLRISAAAVENEQ
jgi:O-antigen ligase